MQFTRRFTYYFLRGTLLISLILSLFLSTKTGSAQTPQPQWTAQEALLRLGIQQPSASNLTELSLQAAGLIQKNGLPADPLQSDSLQSSGLVASFSGKAALSSAILTALNSNSNSNFRELILMADADGSEDGVADHSARVSNISGNMPDGWTLTRTAISEHTVANGFTHSIYYYGDSLGNVIVGADSNGSGQINTTTVLNLPTMLNAFGTLNSDDQIVITGLAVNPVADLGSYSRVNGNFNFFNGKIGEILYVSFWDTGGGIRTVNNQLVQSGVLAFPIADVVSPDRSEPGIQSEIGFPVTVGGAFGVVFSPFANLGGIAVDDDGSLYLHQVDLTNYTGGSIVKISSTDRPGSGGYQDRSLATSGFVLITNLNTKNGILGTSSGPSTQFNRATNFSGTSPTFGNIVSLAAGPNNILYAALARSYVSSDAQDVQNTEGLFANPDELGATPSMIISFADTSGAFDSCTAPSSTEVGALPIADGFADVAQAGLTLQPGVNNFRIFALGDGPDIRGTVTGATVEDTLQVDFQVDETIYSGLVVDEENKVSVISGGTPAGIGLNPSPERSEILSFPDQQPFDRRADAVDLRGDQLSTKLTGGGTGNGLAERFDYIYYKAPVDQISFTPVGLSGLSRGFLLYLNRTRENLTAFTALPNGQTQASGATSGAINFDDFDPSHQIAGGDDQTFPYSGDDNSETGNPYLSGGFEYLFRSFDAGTGELLSTSWNGFYLNSNGNLTFGSGDATSIPTVDNFLAGPPRIAGAWADINTGASWQDGHKNTFPVQAMGFAGINHFIVRWIDTPTTGAETCDSSNSFSISLYDDGTGMDENANQTYSQYNPIGNGFVPFDLQEGATGLRYFYDPANDVISGANPRSDRSGNVCLTYGRMDLLGSQAASDQVLVGLTPGQQLDMTTAGINLGEDARANDLAFPEQQGIPMGSESPASPYEFFTLSAPADPVFDLRQEGNDPASSTPANQADANRGQVCFHNLLSQTVAFAPLSDLLIGQSQPLSAMASSGLPVSFSAAGGCFVDSGPQGPVVTATAAGSCTITANQPGDDVYAASPYVPRTFMIYYGSFLPILAK